MARTYRLATSIIICVTVSPKNFIVLRTNASGKCE